MGVKTQGHSELLEEIDSIYNERINKLSDLVVRYENVLKKLQDKINDVESNKRIFNLQESKKDVKTQTSLNVNVVAENLKRFSRNLAKNVVES